jgi:hypothetical protein
LTEQEIRIQSHAILNAHDDALVSAVTANRAALRLLNRLMDEGVDGEPKGPGPA